MEVQERRYFKNEKDEFFCVTKSYSEGRVSLHDVIGDHEENILSWSDNDLDINENGYKNKRKFNSADEAIDFYLEKKDYIDLDKFAGILDELDDDGVFDRFNGTDEFETYSRDMSPSEKYEFFMGFYLYEGDREDFYDAFKKFAYCFKPEMLFVIMWDVYEHSEYSFHLNMTGDDCNGGIIFCDIAADQTPGYSDQKRLQSLFDTMVETMEDWANGYIEDYDCWKFNDQENDWEHEFSMGNVVNSMNYSIDEFAKDYLNGDYGKVEPIEGRLPNGIYPFLTGSERKAQGY